MTDILIAPRGTDLADPQVATAASSDAPKMCWRRRLARFGILTLVVGGLGAATALAAAAIAAVATYYAGRWAGRGALGAKAGGRMQRLDHWLNRRGLSAVLLVRFLPLAPFGLIGYAYGTTSVCRKRYLLGTTLAAIPSTVTYAVIGAAVTAPGELNPLTLAPALIGFTLTTTIVVRWRRASRREAALTAA